MPEPARRPAPDGDPAELLARAQALVDAALARAGAGDWERVGALDREIHATLRVFAAQLSERDPRPFAAGLARLRDGHHELRRLAEAERDRLAEAHRRAARGRAGARAYEENT